MWRGQPWLEAFSREHTLLRYDARGCGLSDREPNELSFESWVLDLECVIEAAALPRFDLLAKCQGGPIAIEYAARHPDRVNRLILFGTNALGRLRQGDRPGDVEKAHPLLDLTRLGWGRENHAFLQSWASLYQPAGRLDLRSWCDHQCAATSAETAARVLKIGWEVDVTAAARSIKCPVLVLHCERDAVIPIEQGRPPCKPHSRLSLRST